MFFLSIQGNDLAMVPGARHATAHAWYVETVVETAGEKLERGRGIGCRG